MTLGVRGNFKVYGLYDERRFTELNTALRLLRLKERVTSRDLVKALGCSPEHARLILRTLRDFGVIAEVK